MSEHTYTHKQLCMCIPGSLYLYCQSPGITLQSPVSLLGGWLPLLFVLSGEKVWGTCIRHARNHGVSTQSLASGALAEPQIVTASEESKLLFPLSPPGMCNPRNYSDTPPTSKSTVEELHEPIPSLFRALTEGDTQLNWNIVSFPVAEELSHHENLVSFLETVNQPHHQNVSVPSNNVHAPYPGDKGTYPPCGLPCGP